MTSRSAKNSNRTRIAAVTATLVVGISSLGILATQESANAAGNDRSTRAEIRNGKTVGNTRNTAKINGTNRSSNPSTARACHLTHTPEQIVAGACRGGTPDFRNN